MHFHCIFTANYIRRPLNVTPRSRAKGPPNTKRTLGLRPYREKHVCSIRRMLKSHVKMYIFYKADAPIHVKTRIFYKADAQITRANAYIL